MRSVLVLPIWSLRKQVVSHRLITVWQVGRRDAPWEREIHHNRLFSDWTFIFSHSSYSFPFQRYFSWIQAWDGVESRHPIEETVVSSSDNTIFKQQPREICSWCTVTCLSISQGTVEMGLFLPNGSPFIQYMSMWVISSKIFPNKRRQILNNPKWLDAEINTGSNGHALWLIFVSVTGSLWTLFRLFQFCDSLSISDNRFMKHFGLSPKFSVIWIGQYSRISNISNSEVWQNVSTIETPIYEDYSLASMRISSYLFFYRSLPLLFYFQFVSNGIGYQWATSELLSWSAQRSWGLSFAHFLGDQYDSNEKNPFLSGR